MLAFTWRNLGLKLPFVHLARAEVSAEANLFDENTVSASIKQNTAFWQSIKVFVWFCDGYVAIFTTQPLRLAGMHYLYRLNPLIALWGIELSEQPNESWVTWLQFLPY